MLLLSTNFANSAISILEHVVAYFRQYFYMWHFNTMLEIAVEKGKLISTLYHSKHQQISTVKLFLLTQITATSGRADKMFPSRNLSSDTYLITTFFISRINSRIKLSFSRQIAVETFH